MIFLAAMAVGLAYNQISPLGIRPGQPTSSQVTKTAEPPITRVEGSPYGNQTLALAWIDGGSTLPAAPQAPSVGNAPLPHVTWADIRAEVGHGSVSLVDARMPFQFKAGHIPGAISLPVTAAESELDAFAASVSRARRIVVYCSNADCPMADRLGQALMRRFGYRNVSVLQGGYVAYRQAEARPADASPNVGGAQEEDL